MWIPRSSPLDHLQAFALVFLAGVMTGLSWAGLAATAVFRRRRL